jgi:hypothetical protein
VALQWIGGAFQSGFGAHPDEPAHYVTGLMVRDYIAHFFPGSPIAFAKNYYLHYPEVAFGHWPPMFYLVQAAWTLLAPVSHASLLLLMAVLTAATAAVLDYLTGQWGLAAGILFVALPITQIYTSSLMAEAPLALFSLLSLATLIRFLEKDTLAAAVLSGVLISAAILTKPSGWAIAMVPVFSLLITRNARRLLSPRLWICGGIIAVLCVPYYWLTLKLAHAGMEGRSISWNRTWNAVFEYASATPATIGIALTALAMLGMLIPFWKGTITYYWSVLLSFCLAVVVFHAVVPTSAEPRKIFMAVPVMLLFAVAGARWIARWKWLLGAAAVAVLAGGTFAIAHRTPAGWSEAAEYVMAHPELQSRVCLVSSTEAGADGGFIAEIASRESRRPGRFVLRASKQLQRSTWNGLNYTSLFGTPAEMKIALDRIPVNLLAVETAPARELRQHERTLRDMLEGYRNDWERIYEAAGVTIYRRTKDLSGQPVQFEVDLAGTLGGVLRHTAPEN